MPSRIQRRRAKGWRMPAGAVDCGPGTPWANPFVRGQDGTLADCMWLYARLVRVGRCCRGDAERLTMQRSARAHVITHREELRGHDLACTCRLCPDHAAGLPLGIKCKRCAPCHVDVLIEVVNA